MAAVFVIRHKADRKWLWYPPSGAWIFEVLEPESARVFFDIRSAVRIVHEFGLGPDWKIVCRPARGQL